MKRICPICKKEREDVGPKIVGQYYQKDPRFVNQQQYLKTVVMCDECLKKLKRGEIEIVERGN